MTQPVSVAIIGCGIAGVSLGRMIADRCPRVALTLFDKARSAGGRMATRYTDQTEFDHGAQFFTVRCKEFERFLTPFNDSFDEWDAKVTTLSPNRERYKRDWFEPHFVSSPRMNSLCKHIVEGLDTRLDTAIIKVSGQSGHWFLETQDTLYGPFNWVISTAPEPQTNELLNIADKKASYDPIFALMAPIGAHPGFDAAVVNDSPLAWLAINSAKPQRQRLQAASLTAHADPRWSAEHVALPREAVRSAMLAALDQLGVSDVDTEQAQVHLWRYGRVSRIADDPYYLDLGQQLGACGDWAAGKNVEDAFASALRLFSAIEHELHSDRLG